MEDTVYGEDTNKVSSFVSSVLFIFWYHCNSPMPRSLAIADKHDLYSREYYGDVFIGILQCL
jgi:hypothetical protein